MTWRQLRRSFGAFTAIAANPQLRRLELAWLSATFAYSGLNVVVILYAYDHGGASAVGVIALLRVLPGALASPFTSVLADRYRRERVLLISNLLRTAFTVTAAAIAIGGGSAWVVFLLTALIGIAGSNFRPAQAALIPELARSPEELTAANVAAGTIQALGLLVAPAVAGALVAAVTTGAGFLLVGGLFVVSTALVAQLRRPAARGEGEHRAVPGEPVGVRVLAGFRALAAQRGLRLVIGLIAMQTFVAGALAVLNVLIAIQMLGLGNAGVGYLTSAVGIGGLLGSFAAAALVGRRRLAPPFMAGIFLWSLPLALLAVVPNASVALVGWGLVGVANMLSDVSGFTLVQRSAPDAVLARVFGILEMTMYGAMALGSVVVPLVVDRLGIRGSLLAFGLLLPVCTALVGRQLVRVDLEGTRPGEALDLLREINFLAALPATTLEQLAADAQPQAVASGELVFDQGDVGDRFYLVVSGRLHVVADEQVLRQLERGDYFGEIALLRDTPRTAAVRAETDAGLLTLTRERFVPAVTGNRASAAAADVVVAERLGIASVG